MHHYSSFVSLIQDTNCVTRLVFYLVALLLQKCASTKGANNPKPTVRASSLENSSLCMLIVRLAVLLLHPNVY